MTPIAWLYGERLRSMLFNGTFSALALRDKVSEFGRRERLP